MSERRARSHSTREGSRCDASRLRTDIGFKEMEGTADATATMSARTARVCRRCFVRAYAAGGYTRRTYASGAAPASMVVTVDPDAMEPYVRNCVLNGGIVQRGHSTPQWRPVSM